MGFNYSRHSPCRETRSGSSNFGFKFLELSTQEARHSNGIVGGASRFWPKCRMNSPPDHEHPLNYPKGPSKVHTMARLMGYLAGSRHKTS